MRIRAPISPPPARKLGSVADAAPAAVRWIFWCCKDIVTYALFRQSARLPSVLESGEYYPTKILDFQ
jgi:hypothetical protein